MSHIPLGISIQKGRGQLSDWLMKDMRHMTNVTTATVCIQTYICSSAMLSTWWKRVCAFTGGMTALADTAISTYVS